MGGFERGVSAGVTDSTLGQGLPAANIHRPSRESSYTTLGKDGGGHLAAGSLK